jgi:methylmalonyl-CoA/ethylmalonyl-CoA epimerase
VIEKIDHVAMAVEELDQQVAFYRDVLGLRFLGEEIVADQGVRVAFLAAGDCRIELLAPLSSQSPLATFLDKRGQGIHHIAYQVDDLPHALTQLEAAGVMLIDRSPRRGGHGNQIAFIHPRSTFGALTELCCPSTPGSTGEKKPGGGWR